MDLLQRELERKKKAVREAKTKATAGSHRYVKAGDLRRHQEAQEEERRWLSSSKRRKLLDTDETDEAQSPQRTKDQFLSQNDPDPDPDSSTNTPSLSAVKTLSSSSSSNVPQHQQSSALSSSSSSLVEIQQQLRSLGLPVTLFGEHTSIEKRIQRLHNAERALRENQLHRSEADEFRLGQGHGIRNPFLEKEDAAHTDQALLQAEAAAALGDEAGIQQKTKKPHDQRGGPGGDKNEEHVHDEDDDDDPHKLIYKHFKGLLQQWEADLNARTGDGKRTVAGRNETKTLKQCRDYIRPLFKLCKRRQLEENMLHKLSEMVQHCRAGEFVKAHDAYMDLAIGRSAWPIGVTQVGIHSRTGREKIGANNVAHVMNSELQRKYLTSVKRLLTYEQKKRTDVDPSKKVMN